MQIAKASAHPVESPSYGEMQKHNETIWSEREYQLMSDILNETIARTQLSPLYLNEVAKATDKILNGTGWGEVTIEMADGKITFVRGMESVKMSGAGGVLEC